MGEARKAPYSPFSGSERRASPQFLMPSLPLESRLFWFFKTSKDLEDNSFGPGTCLGYIMCYMICHEGNDDGSDCYHNAHLRPLLGRWFHKAAFLMVMWDLGIDPTASTFLLSGYGRPRGRILVCQSQTSSGGFWSCLSSSSSSPSSSPNTTARTLKKK